MSRPAVRLTLDACEQALLQKISRQRSVPEEKQQRVLAVLLAATGLQNKEIAPRIGLNRTDVGKWRNRWSEQHQQWRDSDASLRPRMTARLVLLWLSDKKGRGRKERIVAEQRAKIAALSLETPEQNGLPVTHWTLEHLANVSVQRGIVDSISPVTVHRILKKTICRPTVGEVG